MPQTRAEAAEGAGRRRAQVLEALAEAVAVVLGVVVATAARVLGRSEAVVLGRAGHEEPREHHFASSSGLHSATWDRELRRLV